MAPVPLVPGVPTAVFTRVVGEVKVRGYLALAALADGIKNQAKINAADGSHLYGTKTPAFPGTGPATISTSLVRSIDRSTVDRIPNGWMCKVGTKPGTYPRTYRSKKSSAEYSYILERVGCRNGAVYPWLEPAFTYGVTHLVDIIFTQRYGYGWARMD